MEPREQNRHGVCASPGAGAAGGKRRWAWIAALLITAAVAAAYSNSFRGPFLFDDRESIEVNHTIRDLRAIGRVLKADLPAGITVRGRPVVNLSLAVNYAFGGLDVRGYHALNVTIHALAALVLFGLVRRTLLLPGLAGRFGSSATFLAFATALLWALHPLQTQSVTYIVQRAESLMGLFFLLTLYCLNRGSTSRRPWAWYAASTASCLAGMASKEVMAVAPVMALVYDAIFLAGTFRGAVRKRPVFYLALAGTWGLLAAVALGARGETAGLGADLSPWQYGATQLWAIARYLSLTFWPDELVLDYGQELITDWHRLVAPGLVVVAVLAATGLALWRAPKAGFLGAAFFLVLAPTSSLVPVASQTVAEHRMYLPLAAVAAAVVLGGYVLGRRLPAWRKAPKALGWVLPAILTAACAALLGVRTYLRNADYRMATRIWEDTAAKRPENYRAHYNLGACYSDEGRMGKALREYRKAVELLDRAIARTPRQADLHYSRGDVHKAMEAYPTAVADYGNAIALRPTFAQAYNSRAVCHFYLGRLEPALQDYDRALALAPRAPAVYYNRAVCRYFLLDYAGAREDVQRCRQLGGSPDVTLVNALNAAVDRPE